MKTSPRHSAFTLIELLMVIAIIGILAAIAMPSLKNFRAQDALAASTRQLLDDVARARQYAISQRTTVYMIFCPQSFWSDPAYSSIIPNLTEKAKAEKLFDKQLTGYTFVTLRSVGDQPGPDQHSPRYLSSWRVLPEGAIIAPFMFNPNTATAIYDPPPPLPPTNRIFQVKGFGVMTNIPFPSVDAPWRMVGPTKTWVSLPYIAFNHLGQLEGQAEYIPVGRGSINYSRSNGVPVATTPDVTELPTGNITNAFMLIHIDRLTGRARLEKQEFR